MVNMFTAPSAKQIKIIQDIQLRKPQNDCDQFRKKRRVTSSTLMLDEEPVFSDSDEERQFGELIFGSIQPVKNKCPKAIECNKLTGQSTTIPVKDKYRDVEVQCDLLTPEKALYRLINQCSKLNADEVGDLKDIVKSCEKFITRRSLNINEADALGDISYISNDARYSSPTRKKKSRNECRKKSGNKKGSKRIPVKPGINDPISSTKISNSTFKKPSEVGNTLEISGSSKHVIDVKSLARNWMKPYKSFCCKLFKNHNSYLYIRADIDTLPATNFLL
ncbi:unnamed protein product [Psylliodes chrysocephalus]|uniref:Uncharacterized protein n=1 Tax=Psylliodes chrysocephalus TaxID=3402493 RepID=A0A9P0GIX9_9CUCU|nr:unnamed protein product [Psylliodes chrysocephala]